MGTSDRGLVVELVEGNGALGLGMAPDVSRERSVGRLGVDFDWKPEGAPFPRLGGDMLLYEAQVEVEPHVTMACFLG